jgi:hypothetical protein
MENHVISTFNFNDKKQNFILGTKRKKDCCNLHKDRGVDKEDVFIYNGTHPSGCMTSGNNYTSYFALIAA